MKADKLLKSLTGFVVLLIMTTNLIIAQVKEKPQKCIMVFGSHADDVESMAGGTFAKYITEGYQGVYVCVMNNLAGCAIEGVGGGTSKGDNPGSVSVFSVSIHPLIIRLMHWKHNRSEKKKDCRLQKFSEQNRFFWIFVNRKYGWDGN